jgi:transcriptional regulator with XRE-family HTH domain
MARKSAAASTPRARRKLTAPGAAGKAVSPAIELRLGNRISALREARGLTQDQLAASAGFTKGYFSKIENSKAMPLIGTLLKIADVLGVDLVDLFDGGTADMKEGPICLTRSQGSESIVKGKKSFGYDYVALAQNRHDKHMHPFVMVLSPEVNKHIRFEHEGEEFMYVLSGKVEFEAAIDGRRQVWVLSPGDSVYFDSKIAHRGRSLRGVSRVLVVTYAAGHEPPHR